jgi:hypothetical protein
VSTVRLSSDTCQCAGRGWQEGGSEQCFPTSRGRREEEGGRGYHTALGAEPAEAVFAFFEAEHALEIIEGNLRLHGFDVGR